MEPAAIWLIVVLAAAVCGFWFLFVKPFVDKAKTPAKDAVPLVNTDALLESGDGATAEQGAPAKGFEALAARAEASRAAESKVPRKVSLAGVGAPIGRSSSVSVDQLLENLPSRMSGLAKVEEFHADLLNVVEVKLSALDHLINWKSAGDVADEVAKRTSSGQIMTGFGGSSSTSMGQAVSMGANFISGTVNLGADLWRHSRAFDALKAVVMRRTLLAMPKAERAYLKLADILLDIGRLEKDEWLKVRAAIVFAGGAVELEGSSYDSNALKRAALMDGLRLIIIGHFGDVATAGEKVQAALRKALRQESSLDPTARALLERAIYSGNRWLTEGEGKHILAPVPGSPSALRVGTFPGAAGDLMYDRQESLITIAPPGSGKTQAQVLRNLLHLKAPAVVLDVKGDMLRQAGAWRAANVGPVFAFSPKDPDNSISFSPLDFIRSDPAFAYDDARTMADLLMTPVRRTAGMDDYFERRSRDLMALALLDVALSESGERRVMSSVLDTLYVSESEPLLKWLGHLERLGVSQLRRLASSLRGMPDRQREGIFDTARASLEIWQSPAIERLSTKTTFTPDMLRRDNATLFLCVDLEDIEKYASVLRALVGVIVNGLCRGEPEAAQLPVTVFLDEMPRLGRMDLLERALDIGRGYGVRLWMFAQNYGQLKERYPNADGLLRNCFVRCYISPDEEEALRLSRNLGLREGLIEGERRPLMEGHQLAGPDFAGQMLVFLREQYPARLEKRMAFADPVCLARMKETAPA